MAFPFAARTAAVGGNAHVRGGVSPDQKRRCHRLPVQGGEETVEAG